jgi:hypothetical protein
MLKIDVQGCELKVLRGAQDTLERTEAIQVELNYVHHYQDACSFNEVHSFLTSRRFFLHGISEPYWGNDRPLWADAVYTRANRNVS